MGFLTNVSISNDSWHEIAKDPQKLVDAISIGMQSAIRGPIHEALRDRGSGYPEYDEHVRRSTPYGVTVHMARHYDDPQVIVNPYGNMATAAHEIPHAIDLGWLDSESNGAHRRKLAEKCAEELEDFATLIRQALKAAK